MSQVQKAEHKTIQSQAQAGWRFWLQWILVTGFGLLIANMVGIFVMLFWVFRSMPLGDWDMFALESSTNTSVANQILGGVVVFVSGGAVAGLIIGTVQWLSLREYVQGTRRWIIATTIGTAATWLIFVLTTSTAVIYGIWFGAIHGLMQWMLLRRKGFISILWIPASMIGWSIGFGITQYSIQPEGSFVAGLVAGAITGLALVLFLRRTEQQRIV